MNKQLFGGSITSVFFNLSLLNSNDITNSSDYYDAADDSGSSGKDIMTDQNLNNDQPDPTRTTYTTVTYSRLDTGLSITISETITITNNNFDKSPIQNKNYELILVPTIDHTKTIVVPNVGISENSLPSPAAAAAATTTTKTTTTNFVTKSPSHHNLPHPIKSINDSNFAYIDESSDDHSFSSGDGII